MVEWAEETGSMTALVIAPADLSDHLSRDIFQKFDFRVSYADTLVQARNIADQQPIATVFAPLQIGPDITLRFIGDLLRNQPDLPLVVISQNDQIDHAAQAMRLGAFDCIFLPFTKTRLEKTVSSVFEKLVMQGDMDHTGAAPGGAAHDDSARNTSPRAQSDPGSSPSEAATLWVPEALTAPRAVLSDIPIQPILRALNSVAPSRAHVFIQGETGTGKHALARAIHAQSSYATAPFLVLDCATLSADMLAEHFLADTNRIVDKATLLFENIARTDWGLQTRIMRFLESGDVSVLGGHRKLRLDVRVICTSTTDPQTDITAGRLHEDLHERLCDISIHLPPLRERPDDMLAVAQAKLRQLSGQQKRRFRGFSDEARELLSTHPWPGNIRQLAQVIEQIVLTNDATHVTAEMLPKELLQNTRMQAQPSRYNLDLSRSGLLGRSLDEVERIVIEETIRAQKGSVPKAAKILGVSPSTLYRKRESWKAAKMPRD